MESFLRDLKHQVRCSLCDDAMVEPKLLPCFHTFCKSCIKTEAQLNGEVNVFKCPQCSSLTELKDLNDVEDLEISSIHSRVSQVLSVFENQKVCSVSATHCDASSRCLDCAYLLCDECLTSHSIFTKNHKVVPLSEMTKQNVEAMFKKENPCKTHANQDVKLYCQDCDELICPFCLMDHQHNSHKISSLNEFITAQKDSLSKNLQEIEKIDTNEKEKKNQELIALNIKRDGEKAEEQVKKFTKKLVKIIIDQEQEFLNKIKNSIKRAEWNLRIIRHTKAAQGYMKYFIQNGTASDINDLRSDTECSELLLYTAFERDLGGMKFQPNEELCEQLNIGFGLVQSFKRADSNNSTVKGVIANEYEAMKTNMLTVTLRTYKGELCDPPLDNLAIHISPEDDVKIGEKKMKLNGQIEIPFTPCVPGQFTAKVQVHGNPISSSALVMNIKPQRIEETDENSTVKNALSTGSQNFRGIAVNKSKTMVAIADFSSCCVRVFDTNGVLLLLYGSKGSGQGQLNYPGALSFLNETDLVISDHNNHRMCIVNTISGTPVRTFGCHGNMNGQFNHPCGVHVDDDSNIIVCDHGNHRVQVFTKEGDYLYQFTMPGQDDPFAAVTHNGLLYVSSNSGLNVMEIKGSQQPTIVTTIGGKDNADGCLKCPRGLAIDNDNNLLVCDYKSKRVYKFMLDGRYVGKTNELSSQLFYIAVLNDGQILCSTHERGVYFLR